MTSNRYSSLNNFYKFEINYKPGKDSSKVGSSRLSNSFMTISHTGWLRLGQFWAFPLHLWGILKNRVYGQMGTRPREAVMEASYTKNWCSIIWNCLLPPTLRYGARIPTIEPSEMFANLLQWNAWSFSEFQ